MIFELDTFASTLARLTTQQSLVVGYSGGLDSTVLLHLLWRLRQQRPALQVRAIYIHHGLSQHADSWQQHCADRCAEWGLPFSSYRLSMTLAAGDSVEECAREARYAQLQQALSADECLLTAHHADDQAETLLLQLLRGAGLAGLAAMPAVRSLGAQQLVRPLLEISRAQLHAYAQRHQLRWIEDDSNSNLQFDRNYLREQVMPMLRARWPAVASTLGRSARHVAEAHQTLQTLAKQDYAVVRAGEDISLSELAGLSLPRQYAVIRYWMRQHGLRAPSAKQLQLIFDEVIHARRDAVPSLTVGAWQVRRFQQRLSLQPLTADWRELEYTWDLQQPLRLPQATLQANFAVGCGLRWEASQPTYTVRFRRGGERIKPLGARCTYSLKKLMHAQAIPVWQRGSIPLIYQGDALVMVVGYWVSAAHAAAPGQMGCEIHTTS